VTYVTYGVWPSMVLYARLMLRLASCIGRAGVDPVAVGTGAPGSRPQSQGEILVAERGVKPMAKLSGGQRESEGVVVVPIGVQSNAPGAKEPCFHRACRGGMR
jgi:hypothetical protein